MVHLPQFTDTALEMDDSIPAPIPLAVTDSDISLSPEDSIPATIPLTTANFNSPVLRPTFIVIIDSGSTKSKLQIFGPPQANDANGNRLGVGHIFDPIQSTTEVPQCGGGKLQPFPSPIRIIERNLIFRSSLCTNG